MRKFISLILTLCLVASIMTTGTSAAVGYETKDGDFTVTAAPAEKPNEPTTEELEAVIKLVKPKLNVPEDYTEFTWNYYGGSFRNDARWNLQWYNKENTCRVNVTCDGEGRIQSLNKSTNNDYNYNTIKLPQYKKSELSGNAKTFLKKIVPEVADSLVLTDSYSSLYSKSFTYSFGRNENDITFVNDSANVTVDFETGEVKGFYSSLTYDEEFPKPENIISLEKAKEILGTTQKMELKYFTKSVTENNETKLIAYLVYVPTVYYAAVDAYTGEVYTTVSEWRDAGMGGASNGSAEKSAASTADKAKGYTLNDAEIAKLEELEKLITKVAAIKAVTSNESLYLNPDLTSVEAQLSKNYQYKGMYYQDDKDEYVWNISFSNPRNDAYKYNYAYAYATVDAQTGKLISFYSSLNGNYYYEQNKLSAPEIKFTNEQCQSIFENFLKEQQPEKLKNSVLSSTNDYNPIKYLTAEGNPDKIPVYGAISYNYSRVNEGIVFNDNSINGTVDAITGKISSYSYYWYDSIQFESPKDIISADKAFEYFANCDGFGLYYERNDIFIDKTGNAVKTDGSYVDYNSLYDHETEIRLVYSASKVYPTSISAFTGEQLDYNGEPYKPSEGYKYSDIDGHWAKDDILMFADLGIGFEGDKFYPDKAITESEFKYLANMVGLYGNDDPIVYPMAKPVLSSEAAYAEIGVVDGGKDVVVDTTEITRMDAVKFVVSAFGYSKIASLTGIYKTDFLDDLELKPEDVGYAAIARGLKVIDGYGGEFRPYEKLTRAEAVKLLINSVTIER